MRALIIAAALSVAALGLVELWHAARGAGYKSGYSQCLGEQDDDRETKTARRAAK